MTDLAAPERTIWLRYPGLRIGTVVALLFLLLGFVSIVWTPYPVAALDVGAAMQDPGPAHWLGTDHLGRDTASLVMKGILTSFVVAGLAVAIGAVFGVPLGLAAAAWTGPADWAILRLTGFLAALPALIVAVAMTFAFGPSTLNVMIALGLAAIPVFARATRNGMLAHRDLDYVAAARLAGLGGVDVLRRHILPALARLLLVAALGQLAAGIIAEATLAYVGLGTQPPATSLGLLLRDAQSFATSKPLLVMIPGLAVVVIVVALHLAADGLRALLEPRLRIGADDAA